MSWELLLSEFSTCRLEDLPAQLVYTGRKDIKYPMSIRLAVEVLSHLQHDYLVMSINGKLIQHYATEYFDTPELRFYHDHHRGKFNREKQRIRTYEDGTTFWEVKKKNNKGQTLKTRTSETINSMPTLVHQLRVEYDRITFFSKDYSEKLTLDMHLQFSRRGESLCKEYFVVMESKGMAHQRSPFNLLMRELRIRSSGFSKYCAGMAMLVPSLKSNNFKDLIRKTLNH